MEIIVIGIRNLKDISYPKLEYCEQFDIFKDGEDVLYEEEAKEHIDNMKMELIIGNVK